MTQREIIKSKNDQREYAAITLQNQLECLLIRDTDAELSSAALSMGVGSFKDPLTSQGIAHYLEHMLFMGTEKYPDENDYSNYITKHSGKNNAYTSQEETNYQLQICSGAFEGALDRFAQFFISPLMSESSSARELNAVDSEHSKNILNDAWRKFQLSKHISEPESPYNKFSTGNKETLSNENLPKILREFYDENYSANLMKLVIYGREEMETLKKWATQMFSKVPNKSLSKFKLPGIPFGERAFKKIFKIVPIQDKKKLELCWILPNQKQHYRSHPGRYLTHLIGHEGKNSLLSYLMKEGLATSLSAGAYDSYNTFCEFSVNIDLTEKGITRIKEIISSAMYYIQHLKQHGVQEWIFKEIQLINRLKFDFMEKKKGMMVTSSMAKYMQTRKIEEILVEPYLMEEWQPATIQELLNQITLQNLIVYVQAKQFEPECILTEPIYKTKYSEAVLGDVPIQPCQVGLPEKNIFIPEDLSVLPLVAETQPKKIYSNKLMEFFFKPDHNFSLPRMNISLRINFNGAQSADQQVIRKMLIEMMEEDLREFTYLAETAQIEASANFVSYYAMEIKIKGFRDSMIKFLNEYVKKVLHYIPQDQQLFATLTAKTKRSYANYFLGDPYRLVYDEEVSALRFGSCVPPEEKLSQIDQVTLPKVREFAHDWKKSVFSEGYIGGNVSEEDALKMVEGLNSLLSATSVPLAKQYLGSIRPVTLAPNKTFIIEKPLSNKEEDNSGIAIHFQGSGQNNFKTDILFKLLESIAKEPAFDYLRTKQQLGYIVFCLNEDHRGVGGLTIIVQSSIKTSYELRRYIDIFVAEKFQEIYSNLTEEDFNSYRQSLLNSKKEKDKNLAAETLRMWNEIVKHKYYFNRKKIELELIPTVRLQDFRDFVFEILYRNPRRLEIHVNPQKTSELNHKVKAEQLSTEKNVEVFGNSERMVKKLPLFPDFYAHQ